jgi:hypothetical protein
MKVHGKTILAVLGAFLMLTFTLPTFFKGLQDNGNVEVGRLDGKKVTASQISEANRELLILRQFGILPQLSYFFGDESDTDRGTHWFLLLHEATKMGIVASDAEINAAFSALLASGVTNEQFEAQLKASGLSQHDLRYCVAHGIMVFKDAILAAGGSQVPVPEVEYFANEELSTVRMQYATIDGTRGWKNAAQPTEEQIKKQFELYKDVVATLPDATTLPPVIDGHTYPFGYKYPDRAQIEYLKFDRTAVAAKFPATRDDYQDAYKYYSTHPDEFRKSQDNSMTVGSGGSQSFDEVRDKLVRTQISTRVDKFLKRVTDRVLETAKAPWTNVPIDSTGFRETLPATKWVDYPGITQELKTNHDFSDAAPEYVRLGTWQSKDALAKDAGIGEAYFENPNGRYSFADLAMHVNELAPPKDNFPRLFQQVGIEGPLLKDDAGNLYIFRVTDAQKSHTPASVDEVRAQVIEDLQKRVTYEQRQAIGKALAASAATGDLSTLAKAQDFPVRTIPDLTHVGKDFPEVRGIPGLVNAAFDLAREQRDATQPAATQNASAKPTTVVNIDSRLEIIPIALDSSSPVTAAAFAANRDKYLNAASESYQQLMIFSWIRLEAVAKRLNYVPKVPFASQKDQA